MKPTIKTMVTNLVAIKLRLKAINKEQVEPLRDKKEELEEQIIEALGDQGLDTTTIRGVATVGINKTVLPDVESWDTLQKYIVENDAFYLLKRAVNSATYREALTVDGEVPGIKSFTRTTLSVRKADG